MSHDLIVALIGSVIGAACQGWFNSATLNARVKVIEFRLESIEKSLGIPTYDYSKKR